MTVAGRLPTRMIGALALRACVFYYEEIAKRLTDEGRSLDLLLAHADIRIVLGLMVGATEPASAALSAALRPRWPMAAPT